MSGTTGATAALAGVASGAEGTQVAAHRAVDGTGARAAQHRRSLARRILWSIPFLIPVVDRTRVM